jgi:hypothetical protein
MENRFKPVAEGTSNMLMGLAKKCDLIRTVK